MSARDETPDEVLRVRLAQWAASSDPADNRDRLAAAFAPTAGESVDLVVLPEAFACDFGSPEAGLGQFAETSDGPFATRLHDLAREHATTAVAGMFETSPDPTRPYNTLVMRGATAAEYRKIHLYDSFGYRESDRVAAGALQPVVVDLNGWRVGLSTCYDLRFPELYRALADQGAEVVLVLAAWLPGERKVEHWETLLAARAIENTAYVVGVGQPEPRYCGHSLVVGPRGEVLLGLGGGEEVGEVALSREDLGAARAANPSLANRRL